VQGVADAQFMADTVTALVAVRTTTLSSVYMESVAWIAANKTRKPINLFFPFQTTKIH
jgi:hypothetical protein